MEIGEDEIEWAVVERLRMMLQESTQAEYDVTQAYAYFTAIVCWVTQRIRTDRTGPAHARAQAMWRRLQQEKLSAFGTSAAAPGMTVADALVMIRNGVAHADGTSVRPLHRRDRGRPPTLTGYAVENSKAQATLLLTASMMVRFGTTLAEEFVKAMNVHTPDLVGQVNRAIREARP